MSQKSPQLTVEEIKRLLSTSRSVNSKHVRELKLKRELERKIGHALSDSQVRYILKKMPELLDEVPTRPEPVLGASHVVAQRLFYVHPRLHLLESYTKTETWYPGQIKEAECKSNRILYSRYEHKEGDVPPVFDCTCGIWVCNSRAALKKAFPNLRQSRWQPRLVVSAQVEVWGKCIEHEWGWRAQYARIIPETIQIYPRVNGRRVTHERLIGHLRRKYGA